MSTQAVSPIRRVAVIGAGQAGRAFALRCLRAGFEVVLEDVLPSRLRLVSQALIGEASGAVHERLQLAVTVEDAVRDADLAIDFVPDELESKLEIFSMIDRMAPPRTLLCTPTDVLSITDLASCTYRPERCFSLRGDLAGDTIAAIHGQLTGTDAAEAASNWLQQLGFCVSWIDDVDEPMLVKNAQG